MPNVNITLYLNDQDYVKYLENKEQYNKEARELIKGRINGD